MRTKVGGTFKRYQDDIFAFHELLSSRLIVVKPNLVFFCFVRSRFGQEQLMYALMYACTIMKLVLS